MVDNIIRFGEISVGIGAVLGVSVILFSLIIFVVSAIQHLLEWWRMRHWR